MVIEISEIESGYLYRTEKNQERVVLGYDSEDKVIYAVRGGDAQNTFNTRNPPCSPERFANACDEKLYKVDSEVFEKIIDACSARKILAPSDSSL